MSKGPGVIEGRIADLFAATRDRALGVADIADHSFELKGRTATRAQRLSATRAAHRLIRRTKETKAAASRLINEAHRAVKAIFGRDDQHYGEPEYDEYWKTVKAHESFQRGMKLHECADRIGVWSRRVPSKPGTIRFTDEFWRATQGDDGRLYFHPPDVPIEVWAVSIQPAGVVWAEAEIKRITERNVIVRYRGESARLDREALWKAWAVWRGVIFVSSRTGRTAQELDALWQERYGGRTAGGAAPAMQMPLAEAIALLGVSVDYTKQDVMIAFRRLAKKAHPDVGGDAAKFQRLVKAKDRLLAALGMEEPTAPTFTPSGMKLRYSSVNVSSARIGSTNRIAAR